MATIAEIEGEIYEKISLLPHENLKKLEKKILGIFSKEYFELQTLLSNQRKEHSKKEIEFYIQSLFGVKINYEFLQFDIIENLFQNADFEFYENEEKTYLFSQKTELLEHDFGNLSVISALDAFHKFGLQLLEQAKEKMYVKVKIYKIEGKLVDSKNITAINDPDKLILQPGDILIEGRKHKW